VEGRGKLDTDLIPEPDLVARLGVGFVDGDVATVDGSLNLSSTRLFDAPSEIAIEALADVLRGDGDCGDVTYQSV
jgi:hypothetical protein